MSPQQSLDHRPVRPLPRSGLRRGFITGSLVLALTVVGGWAATIARLPVPERFTVPVEIAGEARSIRVDAVLPDAKPHLGVRRPAVILLHGIEGARRYRWAHLATARRLADEGYAVFLPHYFDAVDYPDLWKHTPDGAVDAAAVDATCRADAGRWAAATLAALNEVAARPDVDPERIGLVGCSLGGFLALETAQRALADDSVPDARAVVVNWGGFFETTRCTEGFPATLFVHGQHDPTVPLAAAEKSAAAIRAVRGDARVHVVPNGQHIARTEASDRETLAFLARHLKRDADVETNSKTVEATGAERFDDPQERIRVLWETTSKFYEW